MMLSRVRNIKLTDTRLLIGGLVATALISVLTVLVRPQPPLPSLTTRSDSADGAMALRLWLEDSGYTVREILDNPIQFEGLDLIFILDPIWPYSEREAERVHEWVRDGGVLIVAGGPFFVNGLLEPFGLEMADYIASAPPLSPTSPLLRAPPFDELNPGGVYTIALADANPDALVHFVIGTQPVLVSQAEGMGMIWVAGMLRPFTNRGLDDPASAALIANMLAGLPPDTVIGMDEARHGFASNQTLNAWLLGTPAGWSVIAAFSITFVYLLFSGRRFGRPVPIAAEQLRREQVEYIKAIANLTRRSEQHAEVLRHYALRLRRGLAERYRIDSQLSAADFARYVGERAPEIDARALASLLHELERSPISEADLTRLALEVDNWLTRLNS